MKNLIFLGGKRSGKAFIADIITPILIDSIVIPREKYANLEDLLLSYDGLNIYLNKLFANKNLEIKVINTLYYVKGVVIAKWEGGFEYGWTVVAQPVEPSVNPNDPVCYTFEANAITYMKIV